nr:MAG TPA: Transcriptional regulator, LacI family GENOMICS, TRANSCRIPTION, DNA-binding, Transcription.6A [Caudoviricetes sp.]
MIKTEKALILQEEYDHFIRCGISRPLTLMRLADAYQVSQHTVESSVSPSARERVRRQVLAV